MINTADASHQERLADIILKEPKSQCEDLVDYLKKWDHGITRMEAFTELGICELASRIGELEKKGYIFKKPWVKGKAKNGRRWCIKRYYLIGWPNE